MCWSWAKAIIQTDVSSNAGFDLNDPTTNTRGPIACLLAISEEIDIVEIAKFLEKWGFAGDVVNCCLFVLSFPFSNEGRNSSSFAFSEYLAAVTVGSGDVFKPYFYEFAGFFRVRSDFYYEFFVGSCEEVAF